MINFLDTNNDYCYYIAKFMLCQAGICFSIEDLTLTRFEMDVSDTIIGFLDDDGKEQLFTLQTIKAGYA